MEQLDIVKALTALGQETRLAVFRYLMPQGPNGCTAGEIADALGAPPNTLSFHLNRLESAGLIQARRQGRFMFYAAHYEQIRGLLDFLTDDCCGNVPDGCLPVCQSSKSKPKPKRAVTKRSTRGGLNKSPQCCGSVKTGG